MNERASAKGFVLLFTAGVVFHLALCAAYLDFHPDDLYIYAQFVKQFVNSGEIGFNAGESVYGVTSALHFLLWALPLALTGLGGEATIVPAGKVLTVLYTCLWTAGLAAYLMRTSREVWLRAAVMLAVGGQVWLVRWHLSGMETSLADLLFVVFLLCLAARAPVPASIALALMHFTRPETLVWLPVWVAFLLLAPAENGSPPPSRRWTCIGVYAAVCGVLFAVMYAYTGSLVPNTALAKSFGLRLDPAPLVRMSKLFLSTAAFEIALLAFLLVVCFRGGRERWIRSPRVYLVAVMVLTLCGLYFVRGVNLYSRYISFLYPLPILACLYLVERGLPRYRRLLLLVAGLTLAQNLYLSQGVVLPATRNYERSMNAVNRPIAGLLRRTTEPGDTVAVSDIGLIGYSCERRVLDVIGLVSPEVLPVKHDEQGMRRLLAKRRPKYLVSVTDRPGHVPFLGFDTYDMELIDRYEFENMFVEPKTLYYEVYKVGAFW